MTQHAQIQSAIARVDTSAGLSAIRNDSCGAVLWRRKPSEALLAWLDGLPPEQLPSGRLNLHVDQTAEVVTDLCQAANTPDTLLRAEFIDEAVALSQLFSRLMDVEYVRLRLDVVSTNMCRRFHQDAVPARMICTYRGTGTLFGACAEGNNPPHPETAPTGAPLILRGFDWPGTPEGRVLHKSPPIEDLGETRLILVLDPIEGPLDTAG